MPEGGLDSKNLTEALRSRPPELWVEERVREGELLSLLTRFEG